MLGVRCEREHVPEPRRRRDRPAFFDWHGPSDPDVPVDGGHVALPIRYWRTDCFMGVFPADEDAVRALLPSHRLHPVRLPRRRVAVAVVAYDYLETSIGPCGEIGISPLCTLDRAAPPLVPALLLGRWPGFGGFVAHLPVTTAVARDAGRAVWGYPKFVADMDFTLSPEQQSVSLSEGGRFILQLQVRRRGLAAPDRSPLVTYTAHGDRLVRTTVATHAWAATAVGPSAGHLALGDHPLGRQLADLGIDGAPVAVRTFLHHSAILPAGEDIGPVDVPYAGYRGGPAASGRHTVRYDEGAVRVVSEPTRAEPAVGARGTRAAAPDDHDV
jgi:hypothetical protein